MAGKRLKKQPDFTLNDILNSPISFEDYLRTWHYPGKISRAVIVFENVTGEIGYSSFNEEEFPEIHWLLHLAAEMIVQEALDGE